MCHLPSSCRDNGFTLIEVLLALSLSAVLVTLIFGALHTYAKSAAVGHQHLAAEQRAEAAYQFIRDQLREMVPLVINENREHKVLFYGDETRITYVGHVPHHRSAGGLHKNSLFVSGTGAEQMLSFTYTRLIVDDAYEWATFNQHENGTSKTLIGRAASIEFEYFGSENAATPPAWVRQWPTDERLPELIRLRITTHDDPGSIDFTVPVYAHTPTRHIALSIGPRGTLAPNKMEWPQSGAPAKHPTGPTGETMQ